MFKSKTALALQILSAIHIATDHDERITVDQLAELTDKSNSFIEQIVSVLRANELIQGHRGPGGGYTCTVGTIRGYRFTYQQLGLEYFASMFYPEDTATGHLTISLLVMSLADVIDRG